MAKQYVQHSSGQGKKWEVTADSEEYARWKQWKVEGEGEGPYQYHYLPKSEYRLCEPPEVWKDVTEECEIDKVGSLVHNGRYTVVAEGYRRRKVPLLRSIEGKSTLLTQWAIIIEQTVTE